VTSPRRFVRRLTAGSAAATLALTLTACDLGQPRRFTARAEKYCATAIRAIAADTSSTATSPTATSVPDPVAYVVDRFTQLDRVLVIVSTDRGFPGGTDGATLRSEWIRPARASLSAGRPSLDTLRQVVGAPSAQRTQVFAVAARAGDGGVRVSVLRKLQLPHCAALFNEPVPRLST
jgi:hypothetical protein